MFSAFWHNDIVSLGGLLSKNVFLAPVGYDSPQENQIQCSFEYYFTVLVDPLWILFIPTLSSVYCFFFYVSFILQCLQHFSTLTLLLETGIYIIFPDPDEKPFSTVNPEEKAVSKVN